MRAVLARAGGHFTYANAIATLTLFSVLAGGTAIAANQLAKNSVGSKQLKKSAVTTAKVKKNAVMTAKIKNAAVTEAKVKPAGLEGAEISPVVPFGQVIHSSRGHSAVAISEKGVLYPIETPSFSQEAGQALVPVGGIEFEAASTCSEPEVLAKVVADQADPVAAAVEEFPLKTSHGVVAEGQFVAASGVSGPLKKTLTMSPGVYNTLFMLGPAAPVNHNLAIVISGECESGSGLTVISGGVDVIANK